MENLKIAVIILNYKVYKFTIECFKSVKESTYKNIRIYMVDNASGEDKKLEEIPGILLIKNKENLGYSGGNNVGIKKALADGADIILILNPDTTIDKNCIKNLVEGLDETSADITGPKIYFSNSNKIWYAGGIMDLGNVIGKHRGVDEEDKGEYDESIETDFVSGAVIMIKKKVFDSIGFFDEKYFLYYEDSDFCFRAKRAGFKIMYIPNGVVYHENAASAGLGSYIQDYYITRNRMLFASKFLSFRTRFALFRQAFNNLGNPMRRLALWDFLTGNFGKGSLK